jgi:hypothetical protein
MRVVDCQLGEECRRRWETRVGRLFVWRKIEDLSTAEDDEKYAIS